MSPHSFDRTCTAVGAIVLVAFATSAASAQRTVAPRKQGPLVALDSVTVRESANLFVARVGEIGAGGRRVYIADPAEARVLEIDGKGAILRVFGKKGRGPGEFVTPDAIAVGGDTALYVMDNSERRVSVFSLRTGKFERSVVLNAFLPSIRVIGGELLANTFDAATGTSLKRFAPNGTVIGSEGVIPAIALKLPMLQQPFPHTAYVVVGSDVYAAFELSQSLYHWKRGARTADELRLPVKLRRGVSDEKFEQMVRDPAKAGAIAYDHSIPAALGEVAPGVLALVTFDPTLVKGRFTAVYHVTLVNVAQRRICPDIPVDAPHDPLPRVALDGTTLVLVQQADTPSGDVGTAVRRFRIDPTACEWVGIK
jgi:hypothetical protein